MKIDTKMNQGANQMHGKPKNYLLSESRIITESELKKLIKTIKPFYEIAIEKRTNLHHINDYFLIAIGSVTGLRVSEIAGLKIGMIQPNSIEVTGKGNKKRSVPLGQKGKELVREFLRLKKEVLHHRIEAKDYLFLSKRTKPFSRHGINKRLHHWCLTSNIKPYSYHSIRHYYATFCLNQGFNLAEVQKFLGHSSVAVTSMYLHLTKDTFERVNAKL